MINTPTLLQHRIFSLGVLLSLSVLLGTLAFFTWDKPPIPAEPVAWSSSVRWLAASDPSYRLYARHRFTLPDLPKSGWLRLSADNDYILYVNGQIVAQEVSIPRNTTGLGAKRSESHQDINDSKPYRWLIPDWIQIAHPHDWKLTTYVDLTQYLHVGKNAIAVEIQDSEKTARVVIEGAVHPTIGNETISLTTGEVPWRLSTQRQNRQQFFWFEPTFPDYDWIESQGTKPVNEKTYSRISANLFQRPLQGTWITGKESNLGELWLQGAWQLPLYYQRAFIRFAGDEQYGLMINGQLVNRYNGGDSNQLHLYEVTKLLHPGLNTLAVHLHHFWSLDWSRQQQQTLSPDGLLRFYLDGWAEDNGEAIAEINTDSTWQTLETPVADWTKGRGQGSPARLLPTPTPIALHQTYEGDAYLSNYPGFLLHLLGWVGLATLFLFSGAWGVGQLKRKSTDLLENQWQAGATLALPTTLFLAGVALLQHRYAEAARGIWFAQTDTNILILIGALEVGLITGLMTLQRSKQISRKLLWLLLGLTHYIGLSLIVKSIFLFGTLSIIAGAASLPLTRTLITKTGTTFKAFRQQLFPIQFSNLDVNQQNCLLGLVLVISLCLRIYHLDYDNPEPDENVSWDAAHGILRTGGPVTSSGIWYTRSPVYHYLLAIWLRILGDSLFNARLLSAIIGIATVSLIFGFAHYLTKNVWLAFFISVILAVDPWELWYSRNIRFYQLAQFFTVAAFWTFLEGFINQRNRICQQLFFILITLMLLSQEVTLLLLPGFFLIFLFYYKPFKLSVDWSIFLGAFLTMIIFAFNIYFVKIKSLTPLVGLSSYTTSFIKLQFNNVSIFVTNFFVGFNRMNAIYGILFMISSCYFSICREKSFICLSFGLYSNVALITIMVFLKAARYIYPIYPIFILVAICGTFCLTKDIGIHIDRLTQNRVFWKPILISSVAILFLLNIEPIRIFSSYGESIRPRHTDIAGYIQTVRENGDVVISNIPAGHANTSGGADYYLMHRMSFFDAVYKHQGRVIDRWEGGILLTNTDQLMKILEQSNRVWLHMFDRQLPKDPELARFFNHLQALGKPILDTYGARLRVWSKTDGVLQRMPNQGGDFGAY